MSHRSTAPKWNPENSSLKEHKKELSNIENKIAEALKRKIKTGSDLFNSTFENTEFKNLNKKSKVFEIKLPSSGYIPSEKLQCETVLKNILNYKKFWIQSVIDWKPKGSSFETVINSLIKFLFCKYSLPNFLYKSWYENVNKYSKYHTRLNLFVLLAKGESLYKLTKLNGNAIILNNEEILDLPFIPLYTKKQCHLFLNYNKDIIFEEAIVKAQVESLLSEGNVNLFVKHIFSNHYFREITNYKPARLLMEKFKFDCIQWLANQSMLDYNQISPILDYLCFTANNRRSATNINYSIKGRTINSVMESMRLWHEETTKAKAIKNIEWKPCGIKEYINEKINNNFFNVFKIKEILTFKELQKEGKEMHHCVASYSGSTSKGIKSIWSFTKNEKRILTIEINNSTKEIIQIKGKFNAKAEKEDLVYINDWVKLEGLNISKYCV